MNRNRKDAAPVPEAITQLQRQLEQFRSGGPARTKLPESLWQAAVELARQHGTYAVAHPLRLDYTRLKQRLGGIPRQPRKQNKPAFVELIGDGAAALPQCVIEFESAGGGKMRIQWRAAIPPDWMGLLRAWHETQG
ncbi:MAG TPA: hypothetical protein VMJ75_19020 [Candidatus Acidoferrales bacterium]|nr:hypothetical protein [Candidatus Acidoferrales bacterium]